MASQAPNSECRKAAQQADQAFMDRFNSGDIHGAANGVYTKDAVILPPGADMVRGRDEIARFWQAAAEEMNITRVELSTVSFEEAGDHAHQIGRAILTLKDTSQVEAKYVVIWKREEGEWRWHIDIWNLNV